MASTSEDLYKALIVERNTYLEEAHHSAKLTIPSLVPDEQDICSRSYPVILDKPFQSLGARGVNNLASKLLLTLFPPTAPFMKYQLSGPVLEEAEVADIDVSRLYAQLARRESRIQDEVDVRNHRVKVFNVLRQLLVAGNALAYLDPDDGGLQVFPLNSYVVKRDGKGNLIDLVYVEKLDRRTVEDERILRILEAQPQQNPHADDPRDQPVLLYTRVTRDGKGFRSWQEVSGIVVDGSEDNHTKRNLPWIVLRLTAIDGEDYGRGFVEEYRGDLTSLEELRRDIIFAAANAAKVVWGIDPNSGLRVKTFTDAPNGGAVLIRKDDVHAIRLDKGGDMQVAAMEARELEKALSADFLLNSSFQRHQERVTAEEIRRMAEELDDTLGGVFSLLSAELQLPLARLVEAGLEQRDPSFPTLDENDVRISVVTGLAAIGRGQELQRLREGMALVADMSQVIPGLVDYVKEADLSRRIWTGSGVDTQGLLFDEDEVEQQRAEEAQRQQQALLAQEMSKGAGRVAGNVDPADAAAAFAQATNPQG